MIKGPLSYIPKIEEKVVGVDKSIVIKQNTALRVRAKQDIYEKGVKIHYAGENWLVKKVGAYFLGVNEELVDILQAYILTDKKAIHIRAINNYTDVYGNERRNGEEWLVTNADNQTHIIDVNEEFVKNVDLTVLTPRQYCVVLNPVKEGKNQYGEKEIRTGETHFFLQPGESL